VCVLVRARERKCQCRTPKGSDSNCSRALQCCSMPCCAVLCWRHCLSP